MATTEWYMAMAAAMARRERALSMLNRWQQKAEAAEAEIQELANSAEAQTETPVEQVQEQA